MEWRAALDTMSQEMARFVAYMPPSDDSEEVIEDVKLAILTVDDANYELQDIINKFA